MTEVHVIDRDGSERRVDAEDGRPLMEALRDAGTGIEGTCGGECACGTCHVYIDGAWSGALPVKTGDEDDMLDAVSGLVEVRPTSRLSCQIPVSPALAGLRLEIAPEA